MGVYRSELFEATTLELLAPPRVSETPRGEAHNKRREVAKHVADLADLPGRPFAKGYPKGPMPVR